MRGYGRGKDRVVNGGGEEHIDNWRERKVVGLGHNFTYLVVTKIIPIKNGTD